MNQLRNIILDSCKHKKIRILGKHCTEKGRKKQIYIPLDFWFSRNTRVAFPGLVFRNGKWIKLYPEDTKRPD